MLRHSLNHFLGQLAQKQPIRFDNDSLIKAIQYLNSLDFHKRLRTGFLHFRLELEKNVSKILKETRKETS